MNPEQQRALAPLKDGQPVGGSPSGWYRRPDFPAEARWWDGFAWGAERQHYARIKVATGVVGLMYFLGFLCALAAVIAAWAAGTYRSDRNLLTLTFGLALVTGLLCLPTIFSSKEAGKAIVPGVLALVLWVLFGGGGFLYIDLLSWAPESIERFLLGLGLGLCIAGVVGVVRGPRTQKAYADLTSTRA